MDETELDQLINKNLAKMKRNAKVEWLLEQFLQELWRMDFGSSELKVQPMMMLDGKWIANPEYRRVLKTQKDILWHKISYGSFI